MDLRRLEAFSKVYELRSFSKAANELFLSQPTISAHIATLEEETGVTLFDRVGRGILPTQAGDVLYKHTRKIFTAVEKAEADIQLLLNKVSGDLRIGGSTIPANYLLPFVLADFMKKFPEVKIDLSVGDSAQIRAKILSGDLVLGVVGARDDHKDLVHVPVLNDELVVVAPATLSFSTQNISDPEDLLSLPWIMREKGSGTRKAMEEGFERLGLDSRRLKTAVQVHSTGAVLQCVQAGLGVSVTSKLAASSFLEKKEMKQLNVQELGLERTFYAIHHRNRNFFPAARKFIEFLSVTFNNVNTLKN